MNELLRKLNELADEWERDAEVMWSRHHTEPRDVVLGAKSNQRNRDANELRRFVAEYAYTHSVEAVEI